MQNNDLGLSRFFTKVYTWMFIGMLTSGAIAYITSINQNMIRFVYTNFYLIIIAELAVVIILSALRKKVSSSVAKILFILYSALSGLTLCSIFIVFKLDSVLYVFISTAVMFATLSFYGYSTKQDLSSLGKMLLAALISIIICSIINIFTGNGTFGIIISVASVAIFLGLTAWDMQNLKRIYYSYQNDSEQIEKASIFGALNLYLDFINIFLELLNLFGEKKR